MAKRASRNFGLNGPECAGHIPAPEGYLQWHAWAEEMEKTHVQRQCTGCGLWAIWEPKWPGQRGEAGSPRARAKTDSAEMEG